MVWWEIVLYVAWGLIVGGSIFSSGYFTGKRHAWKEATAMLRSNSDIAEELDKKQEEKDAIAFFKKESRRGKLFGK